MEYKPMDNEEFRALTDGISSTRLAGILHRSADSVKRYRCARVIPREIAIKVRKIAEALRKIKEEE